MTHGRLAWKEGGRGGRRGNEKVKTQFETRFREKKTDGQGVGDDARFA